MAGDKVDRSRSSRWPWTRVAFHVVEHEAAVVVYDDVVLLNVVLREEVPPCGARSAKHRSEKGLFAASSLFTSARSLILIVSTMPLSSSRTLAMFADCFFQLHATLVEEDLDLLPVLQGDRFVPVDRSPVHRTVERQNQTRAVAPAGYSSASAPWTSSRFRAGACAGLTQGCRGRVAAAGAAVQFVGIFHPGRAGRFLHRDCFVLGFDRSRLGFSRPGGLSAGEPSSAPGAHRTGRPGPRATPSSCSCSFPHFHRFILQWPRGGAQRDAPAAGSLSTIFRPIPAQEETIPGKLENRFPYS